MICVLGILEVLRLREADTPEPHTIQKQLNIWQKLSKKLHL